MDNAKHIEKSPYVIFGPINEGRNEQALFAVDTAKDTFAVCIDDSYLFCRRLTSAMGPTLLSVFSGAVRIKFFESTAELS